MRGITAFIAVYSVVGIIPRFRRATLVVMSLSAANVSNE